MEQQYKYNCIHGGGEYHGYVFAEGGETVLEVHYPKFHYDEDLGEKIEELTLFDLGIMKNTLDVLGLQNHLRKLGKIAPDAVVVMDSQKADKGAVIESITGGVHSAVNPVVGYADGGQVKNPRLSLFVKKFSDKYKQNEDNNMHSENVVLLAERYGGNDDVRDARKILEKHDAIGHLTPELQQQRDILQKKLYPRYQEELKEAKDKGYMEGGEITEYQGTKAYTVNFKTYRNFPAAWRVIFFWGNTKPFVEVTKVTNNPFGGRLGKDFDTLDKAIAHYKSPEMKVLLLQAGDVAKKAGVPMDMFAMGGMFAEGGDTEKATLLLIDSANPLSSQVQKITGDALNTGDYKDVGVGNFNILTHKKSGRVFIVYPKRIYDQLPKEEKQDDLDYLKRVEKISFVREEKMKMGGKTKNFKDMTFKEKSASVQAKLRGSKVSPKYRKKYGKTYDSKEAKEAADAITGKIVSKMKE